MKLSTLPRRVSLAVVLLAMLVASTVVRADLVRLNGPLQVRHEPALVVKLDGAFDSVNNVHLVVWGTQGAGPTLGQFLNTSGQAIGGPFPISLGSEHAGWARVVYSPQQQRFLVAYTEVLGPSSHQRVARMLTYNNGSPAFLTGEIFIDAFTNAGNATGVAYSAGAGVFMVTWHEWEPGFRPHSYVAAVTPAGVASAPQLLSDPADGQSDPNIACNASGRCLVVGFGWGNLVGGLNTIWARFIDGPSATPVGTTSFYVASWPIQGDATVVHSDAAGQFLVGMVRDFRSVWGRFVDAAGGMGADPFLLKQSTDSQIDGGGFGLASFSYNTGTSTIMLTMGSWFGHACAQELSGSGGLLGLSDCVPGGKDATHYTVSVADPSNQRYVMLDNQNYNEIRSTTYGVTGGGGQPATITVEPASQTILSGQSAVLTVAASGAAPISYQWYEGDSPNTAQPIPGATSNTYATPALQSSKRYWVQVANAFGSDNSSTAFIAATHIANGGFWGNSMAGWSVFATPDQNYIQWGIDNEVLQFYRVPPPSGTNQATVFQQTGASFAANTGIRAFFQLGNTSTVRKRISVLLTDADFSDLAVCTFWLAPNTPLQTYAMLSHTTEAWSNASIYFYAASTGANGGTYLLDNVVVEQDVTLPTNRTECFDPNAPAPALLPHSSNLVANPTFDSGTISPWIAFGTLSHQVSGGVIEMLQPPGPAGSFLQLTGTPMAANDILSASFSLGNSSGVRKRVTVLLHDSDFSDLSVCSFWLPAGAPLQTYAMTMFATKAWSNATLSFYVATQGFEPWVRLDNVFVQRAPTVAMVGTECLEPGAVPFQLMSAAGAAANSRGSTQSKAARAAVPAAGSAAAGRAATPTVAQPAADLLEAAHRTDWIETLDLRSSSTAVLSFESSLSMDGASSAEIQVSEDGTTWQTLVQVPASDDWITLNVDLGAWAGRVVQVRFAFDAKAPRRGGRPDTWLIGDVRVVR